MSGAADAPDRGLHCCFQVANVKPGWAQEFVTRHRLRTLDDFVVAAASEPGEQGVEALVNQVPTLAGNQLAVARFGTALDIAQDALKRAAAPEPKTPSADELLPETTIQSLNQDWMSRYNLRLDPSFGAVPGAAVQPVPGTPEGSAHRAGTSYRVQTSHMADNKVPGLLAMGDKSSLQYDMEEGSPVKSCVDYYLPLRVLAYALAWAGNYQTTNEGGRSLMLDLSTVLHYADGALTASVLPAALCYGSNAMTS